MLSADPKSDSKLYDSKVTIQNRSNSKSKSIQNLIQKLRFGTFAKAFFANSFRKSLDSCGYKSHFGYLY